MVSFICRTPVRGLILTTAIAASLMCSLEAAAQENRADPFQDCASTSPRSIVETGLQVSFNQFGQIDQTVLGASGALGLCATGTGVRWRLEGNYVHVDEGTNNAEAVKIGIGFTARPIRGVSGLTVTPVGRVGYENFSVGQSNRLYGGSVTFEFVAPTGTGEDSQPGLLLELVERPEFVSRGIVHSSVPVASGSTNTFSNFASAGLDGPFGTDSQWRWKALLASTSIAEDVPTNQVFSGVVSIRPTSEEGTSYPWSVELWFSRGNGSYRGLLLSFTLRFD